MKLNFAAQIRKAISGTVKLDLNIVRTVSGLNLKISCYLIDGTYIGSCLYNDFCPVFNSFFQFDLNNCPEYLIDNGYYCSCPLNLQAGYFYINDAFEVVNLANTAISWLSSGDFSVDFKATQGTTSILCLNFKYSLKPCSNQNACYNVPDFEDEFNGILNQDALATFNPSFDVDTIIDLSSKRIVIIDKYTFSSLSNLKTLTLSVNKLASIDSYTFNDLVNLAHLNLDRNMLNAINPLTFANLKNLRNLNLSNNLLASLNPTTFNELTNLILLNLNNNQIVKLEANTFSRLANLVELSINSNNINSIDRLSFLGLSNLEVVNLFGNPIVTTQPTYVLQLCLTNPKCIICIYSQGCSKK